MGIRYRPMRLSDIPECVRCVASNPTLAARYGNGISDLGVLLRRLLANEWFFNHKIFEELSDHKVKLCGIGFSVFVSDQFLTEAKTLPMFWLGPEIARRVAHGASPLLTEKQVAEANSGAGLNVVVCQTGLDPEHLEDPAAHVVAATAFIEDHRGFCLNETVVQAESAGHLAGVLNFGALLFSPSDGRYRDVAQPNYQQIAMQPHLVGTTRKMAARHQGSWIASIYLYQQPQLGFSRSEQRLLSAALGGATDEQLGVMLDISLSAVKKTWRSICARVAAGLPGMIPGTQSEDPFSQDRGKEKKRHLIAYLRDRPEELRPYVRALVQEHDAKSKHTATSQSKARPANGAFS